MSKDTTTIASWTLKERKDLHVARKVWHASGVGLMWAIYLWFGVEISKVLALSAAIIFTALDVWRLRHPEINSLASRLFRLIMRDNERHHLTGVTFVLWGATVLAWIFPPHVVSLSLLFLALSDPISSYVGIRWGRDRIRGPKTLQGFMAGFVTCTLITSIYCYYHNILMDRWLIVSVLGGGLGAWAETFNIGKIDDNFSMPVMSAIGLSLIFYILGAF